MTLTPCPDAAHAQWLVDADVPWEHLASLGPPGLPAYARLRFLRDPDFEGQSENDVHSEPGRLREADALRLVLATLAAHTRTPEDCHLAFWDGWGQALDGPTFAVPNRKYFLFHGGVLDPVEWDIPRTESQSAQQWTPEPAFVWPADHAWCVANGVDPHWAGIGAGVDAINELLAHPRLDVVAADPTTAQPNYR